MRRIAGRASGGVVRPSKSSRRLSTVTGFTSYRCLEDNPDARALFVDFYDDKFKISYERSIQLPDDRHALHPRDRSVDRSSARSADKASIRKHGSSDRSHGSADSHSNDERSIRSHRSGDRFHEHRSTEKGSPEKKPKPHSSSTDAKTRAQQQQDLYFTSKPIQRFKSSEETHLNRTGTQIFVTGKSADHNDEVKASGKKLHRPFQSAIDVRPRNTDSKKSSEGSVASQQPHLNRASTQVLDLNDKDGATTKLKYRRSEVDLLPRQADLNKSGEHSFVPGKDAEKKASRRKSRSDGQSEDEKHRLMTHILKPVLLETKVTGALRGDTADANDEKSGRQVDE